MGEARHYKPTYHAYIPKGWCNDPNGMIYYNGTNHLYFQHYPYNAAWGTMHWGHFTSKDFIKWELQPVALRPDQDYEVICGCCSGNAVEKDGKLYIMYTAAQPDRQRQCLAWSEDGGITFTKEPSNPILTAEMLSPEVSTRDFRDPKIFEKDGWYYCLYGCRIVDPDKPLPDGVLYRTNVSGAAMVHHPGRAVSGRTVSGGGFEGEYFPGYGNLILTRSKDLYHWEYVGKLIYRQEGFDEAYYTLNGVYECPDYFVSNGQDIILSSPQNLPPMGHHYWNQHSVVYILGKLDFETGAYVVESFNELDNGFDIYASQAMHLPDGRIVMISWKEMWDRNVPMRADGWGGTYTLPREVEFKKGRLYQYPVREIYNYRQNKVEASGLKVCDGSASVEGVEGDKIELDVTFCPGDAKKAGVKFFVGTEHETLVYYDADLKAVVFDRAKSGITPEGVEPNLTVRYCDLDEVTDRIRFQIFLDVCSAEIFINDGRFTMTGNMFPDEEDTGVVFFSEGECQFESIVKYDIVVEQTIG